LPGNPEAPVPALVNPAFLEASGLVAGDQIEVGEQFSTTRRIIVTGTVRGFPTADPAGLLALVDLPSMALADYATRNRVLDPREWWLRAPAIDLDAVAATLAEQPIGAASVSWHGAELDTRLGDPIALGVVGALVLGSVAAWFFAALGFMVSAAVAARERLSEFALLRALGLSRRQLAMALSLENGFLLGISLLVGVALGVLLAWVVLPSVTLTPEGTPPLPGVRVALPWDVIALLIALGAVLLVATLFVLRRMADRDALAGLLRLREE
jgi:predicted lysophospholipase L1 biosynthesis ABC-type transport system permease subunit